MRFYIFLKTSIGLPLMSQQILKPSSLNGNKFTAGKKYQKILFNICKIMPVSPKKDCDMGCATTIINKYNITFVLFI